MVMRRENKTLYALGYVLLGILVILMKDSWWDVILAFGLIGIALAEYMGGSSGERNWLFLTLFAILAVLILIGTAWQYWILVFVFIVWGGYEIVEERIVNDKRWDIMGFAALLVGVMLLVVGLAGNQYEMYFPMVLGVMFAIQGLKAWFE
jgi:hypothetical protein